MKKSKRQPKQRPANGREAQPNPQTEDTPEEKKPFWKYFSWRLKKPSSTTDGELWMKLK